MSSCVDQGGLKPKIFLLDPPYVMSTDLYYYALLFKILFRLTRESLISADTLVLPLFNHELLQAKPCLIPNQSTVLAQRKQRCEPYPGLPSMEKVFLISVLFLFCFIFS